MAEGGGEEQATSVPSGTLDVFISYASQDAAVANETVETLERHGLRCWIAPRNVTPGAHYADAIITAISGAKALVLVLSDSALTSKHVGKEIERASSKGRPIIALRTGTAPLPPAFEYFLSESQWIDVGVGGISGVAAKLVEAVRSHLSPSVASEPLDIVEVGLAAIAPLAAAPEGGVKARPVTKRSSRRRALLAAFGVLVVAAGAVLLWLSSRHLRESSALPVAELSPIRSLAVLPLANLSGDPEQAYFADGMTDLLITNLARGPNLRVTSRTSTLRYRGGQKPIPEIARELHVDLVVEGTVVREGQRVRITAQLINAQTDEHVWANSFERDFGGVLALQREVAEAIAGEIGVKLAPWQTATASSPEAQEEYLRGIYAYGMGDMMRSAEALERAVMLDPDHALAYAALARSYYFIAFFGERSPSEAFQRMEEAATKALEKDPTLASAHASLALVKLHRDWKWKDAEQHFRRAIELNPSDADVHHDYAHFLLVMRRDRESLAETERAVALDPFNPMLNACLGWHRLFAGQYDQAIDVARRTLQIQPTNFWARVNLGWAYEQKAMYPEAVKEFRQALEQKPMSMDPQMKQMSMQPPVSMQMSAAADRIEATRADLGVLAAASLGHALGLAGDRPGARAILDQLLRQREHAYVSPYDIALLYVGLAEKDNALDWLQKAYQERSSLLVFALREPRLAPLRSEARFATLTREFALPQ
jgi:TolB-like protein/cytochrome c-type biogenesis protein CcmH/NrfG